MFFLVYSCQLRVDRDDIPGSLARLEGLNNNNSATRSEPGENETTKKDDEDNEEDKPNDPNVQTPTPVRENEEDDGKDEDKPSDPHAAVEEVQTKAPEDDKGEEDNGVQQNQKPTEGDDAASDQLNYERILGWAFVTAAMIFAFQSVCMLMKVVGARDGDGRRRRRDSRDQILGII